MNVPLVSWTFPVIKIEGPVSNPPYSDVWNVQLTRGAFVNKSFLRKAHFSWKHKKYMHFLVFDNKIPVDLIFPSFFLNVWLHRFCFLEVSPWEILLYSQKEISAKLWIVHMIPLFTLLWTKLKYYTNEFVSKWRCKLTDTEFAWTYFLCKTPTYFESIIL